jgi:adenosylmethionine-8-amino-7-oxononanoate aminotransferase
LERTSVNHNRNDWLTTNEGVSLVFQEELNALREAGLLRQLVTVEHGTRPYLMHDGHRYFNASSSNYLGLADHPAVIAAAVEGCRQEGFGGGGSCLITGHGPAHDALEDALAAHLALPQSLVFAAGYQTNVGVLSALAGLDDVIFADALNHASLIDGCRLSRADVRIYRHGDPEHLATLLAREPRRGRRLIVTDGVFSMDGDVAPLFDLLELAARHDAVLVVDDAHGFGVLGRYGGGLPEHFGRSGSVPVLVGTLSKAAGLQGGYVASDPNTIRYLVNKARGFMFATGLLAPIARAAAAAVRIIREEPERRRMLWRHARRVRQRLNELGFVMAPTPVAEIPILAILVGSAEAAVAFAGALRARDVWATAIRPPSVPQGSSRIRLTLMATHDDADVEEVLRVFEDLAPQYHVWRDTGLRRKFPAPGSGAGDFTGSGYPPKELGPWADVESGGRELTSYDRSFDPGLIRAWDRDHVWHPFTQMKDYLAGDPVIIAAADGVRLQDIEGRWYYDGVSSIWLNVHGHRVPEIDRAIREQLDRVAHVTLLGQGHVRAAELAHCLSEWLPLPLTRFFFSESGASAVEVALKMAVQFWANQGERRPKVMGFTANYHGDTLGAMAVAPDPTFHWPFLSYLPSNPRAPYPYCFRCPIGRRWPECRLACLEAVEEQIARHRAELAAVIIEPVQGAGGIIPAPPGYLLALRKLCDEYGVLFIVDEVATGFGRTGRMWGIDHDGVVPDILCLGKGLSGGYLPISATVTTDRVYGAFWADVGEKKALYHGHSYAGNPLAAAAALANLDLFQKTSLLAELPQKSALIAAELAPLRDHPYVGDIRQMGLMVGIELVAARAEARPFPYAVQAGYRVAHAAREEGLLIRPIGNVVIFMPPLASSSADLKAMTTRLRRAFESATPVLAELAAVSEGLS